MPELVEVEAYRALAEGAIGRTVARVLTPDGWFLKRGADAAVLSQALTGARVLAASRVGKLLLLRVDERADAGGGSDLGLRFGMTGRLLLDGRAGVGSLRYSSDRDEPQWDRFGLDFADGGTLRMRDPRRLGGVELDPDLTRLGPDARTIGRSELQRALAGSDAPIKARLLDQSRIAGIGNLIGDEVLWQARLAPTRAAGGLSPRAVTRLHEAIHKVIETLIARGGSHLGDVMAERRLGGRCPLDGAPMRSATIGGRTTWWCPRHQR